jgi:hypothetical protein
MPETPPFNPFVPSGSMNTGLPENLVPNPPADIPEAPEAGDAMAALQDTPDEQEIKDIVANLTLDRPLPLYIPDREKYSNLSFHIINDDVQELAEAMRYHWKPTTNPRLLALFEGKVAGVSKEGKIRRPILMERDVRITWAYDKLKRQRLHDMYAGLDPRNRQFNSKYADTEVTNNAGITKGQFSGAGWRIKV